MRVSFPEARLANATAVFKLSNALLIESVLDRPLFEYVRGVVRNVFVVITSDPAAI